jgi:hypothetical protein
LRNECGLICRMFWNAARASQAAAPVVRIRITGLLDQCARGLVRAATLLFLVITSVALVATAVVLW